MKNFININNSKAIFLSVLFFSLIVFFNLLSYNVLINFLKWYNIKNTNKNNEYK